MTAEQAESGATLREYLHVARRRKWIILQSLVLVPVAALVFSLAQTKLYEATAEVLLSRQNLAAALTGTPDATQNLQADRDAETQANLARVPDVARRVIAAGGVEMTAEDFLDGSSVSAKQNADLLEFRVEHESPAVAQRLATAYAREFADYRRELDTRALTQARVDLDRTITELEEAGDRGSALYRDLVASRQQLRTLEALQTSNAFPVRDAEDVEQVQPKPVRNLAVGLVLGLMLGLALAFLWEALDTRVRSAGDIAATLKLPILARIPEPPKPVQREDGLVMLAQPLGMHAEPFRMLRTNLEIVRLDRDLKTIMITSAVDGEGKSTTVSNLAVALARAGQRVILVDLDFRRPYLDKFFGLRGSAGVTQVALGKATLEQALAPVAIAGSERRRSFAAAFRSPPAGGGNGRGPDEGSLHVLPSGPTPPDPGEFVATARLASILAELRDRADVVLVDAPPVLRVGDALTLSARVDAIVLVTRTNVVRRPMLEELHRLLAAVPAAKLGFVITDAGSEDAYGYGHGYGYAKPQERERLEEHA